MDLETSFLTFFNIRTFLNIPTSKSYGVPEREQKEQEIENLKK